MIDFKTDTGQYSKSILNPWMILGKYINPLKPNDNFLAHLLQQPIDNSSFCIHVFHTILTVNGDYFLKQH
jgi:hypothetical protein